MARETWIVTNLTDSETVTIGDLFPVPTLGPGEHQDLLAFVSPDDVYVSSSLASLFIGGVLNLVKTLDNVSNTYTGTDAVAAVTRIDKEKVTTIAGTSAGGIAVIGQITVGCCNAEVLAIEIEVVLDTIFVWYAYPEGRSNSILGGTVATIADYAGEHPPQIVVSLQNPAGLLAYFSTNVGYSGPLDFSACTNLYWWNVIEESNVTAIVFPANMQSLNGVTLNAIGDGSWTLFSGIDYAQMRNLGYLELQGNTLTSDNIDTILIGLAQSVVTNNLLNGWIYLNNQTPSAPPTEASAAAMDTLVSYGWTISHD